MKNADFYHRLLRVDIPGSSVPSYLSSGTTADTSFEKGIAIVREEKIHRGTIGEDRSRLLRFESESPPHGDAIRDASVTEGTEV